MAILPVGIGSAEEGGYQIERSLRFSGAYPATPSYLSRTPGTPTNNLKWTFSFWLKRGVLGVGQHILNGGTGTSASEDYLAFLATNKLAFFQGNGTTTVIATNALFRDPSAWYHIVLVYDSAQATSTNRLFIYVNGVSQSFSSATYPTLNQATNINANGVLQRISSRTYLADEGLDGYMTEANFIDGQALDPTSFGEYNSETGVWQPIEYTGSYGAQGWYLNFSDNASTTTLGDDLSGNGNDWTTNNFSVTAGAGNDSLVDTPTNYGTDTGVGGEVRGNYATLNPLYQSSIPVDGNLNVVGDSTSRTVAGTLSASTGKWYAEGVFTSGFATNGWFFVWDTSTPYVPGNVPATTGQTGAYYAGITGNIVKSITGTVTTVGTYSTWTNNDIIGMAFDADAGTISFYKKNTLQTTFTDSGFIGRPLTFGIYYYAGNASINFGQRPFAYTAPSGFKALCTQNLPEPTIVDGGEYFNTVLYTGNGSTSNVISGLEFQPNFVWIKSRSTAYNHNLFDVLRGPNAWLGSNSTSAEDVQTTYLNSFTSDGFSLNSGGSTNANGEPYVAWNWKANGAGVSNTDGTITSTVSANTDSGFSIVTYTGTGANATVGHGLGVAPSFIIVKSRSVSGSNWPCYHVSTGNLGYNYLNLTLAVTNNAGYWNSTSPTSSVFSLGNDGANNASGATFVAYCFAAIPGYSAFGSYTGNGSTDGPFVYTGFRPAWILLKNITTGGPGYDWFLYDSARDTYNVSVKELEPNLGVSEDQYGTSTTGVDLLSNGFKMITSGAGFNASGQTYIYMAFAENPFKYSLAR